MGDVVEHVKDRSSNIILKASPFSNIGKQDVLNSGTDVSPKTFRISATSNMPYTSIGNSIMKPGIPTFTMQESDMKISPVILQPKTQVQQMNSDSIIKTIGIAHSRSQLVTKHQTIVKSSIQRSIMESQNVSPLIIRPHLHNTNEIVPAKIIPISSAAVSQFSVVNKQDSHNSVPEYLRQSIITPQVFTQNDFVRFPAKTYNHKSPVLNQTVFHGHVYKEDGLTIPNSQHVFKPIVSPRPSILRKRDAEGLLRAQKNLIPILTKPDIEHYSEREATVNHNSNGFNRLQLESIMVPQISALTRQSHIMVEISQRKKPRKQLLPTNQDSPFKIIGDEMEYIDEKSIKTEKIDEYFDKNVAVRNNNFTAEGNQADDFDDDGCTADDDFEDDGFDFKSDTKIPADLSDESSSCTKVKNKRPSLITSVQTAWHSQSHHFQRYTDFKLKETKKQMIEFQQLKNWMADKDDWRVKHLIKQLNEMVKIELELIDKFSELITTLENSVDDCTLQYSLIELVRDNIQRSIVTKSQLQQTIFQLSKIFNYRTFIEDVVQTHYPKEFKKIYMKKKNNNNNNNNNN